MATTLELLRQGRKKEVWTKLCGYLDLSLAEFMEIQERLLMEQIQLLHNSPIGKKLLGERLPTSVDEFRQTVPLTKYENYVEFLEEQREDYLPKAGPYLWAHTSGRSGEFNYKWAPYSRRMYERLGEVAVGAMILASCTRKGEVNVEAGDVVLLATAPPPYVSGLLSHSTEEQGAFRFVPSLEVGEKMQFGERIAEGFSLAMETGLDYFYGLASVLAKIGERFEKGSGSSKPSLQMLRPRVLSRLIRGMFIATLNKRNMLPKDIWNLKGIMTGGTDTDIYRNRIEYYWGKKPLEGYACTEGGTMAMQSWNCKGMTFFPDNDFLEFIPLDEHFKSSHNPGYQPKTLLYSELQPGIYELVFTNLLGGVFTRYRVGDLFEIISLRDEELNIDLPQVRFYSRINDLIDLGGFARLNEKSIWQAIELAGVSYEDWMVRKEEENGELVLHLYIELKNPNGYSPEELKNRVHKGLKQVVAEFADLENMLGANPLKVTALPAGTWARYIEEQQRAGADLAHTKPPHMQPSDIVVQRLLKVSKR